MPKISLATQSTKNGSVSLIYDRSLYMYKNKMNSSFTLAYSVPIIIFRDTLYILQIIKQCFNIFFHLISSTLRWFAFCNDIL